MYLTGFADEASHDIDVQIQATKELGWKNIESRATQHGNIAAMSDAQFEEFCGKLDDAGISVNCYGSGIANWAKKLSDPPESSYEELTAAIPRLQKLGTKLVRVMSFSCPEDISINAPEVEAEVITRMQHLVRIAEDGGVVLVHENCNNWGGRSYEHTMKLLDAIDSPSFRLVFDTGNPVFRKDIRFNGTEPFAYQSALEFYNNVKDFVDYVHIKDGVIEDGKMRFTFPGEGDGNVLEICTDLHDRGYDGGISIEPHLAVVFHDESVQSEDSVKYANYVEYGKRMEAIVKKAGWDSHD
ncbi:MAG: TIM barrel protein [Chitinivibrionales bacterium]|nr:TIM barrel protein [Chitinivibrionales bacterium]